MKPAPVRHSADEWVSRNPEVSIAATSDKRTTVSRYNDDVWELTGFTTNTCVSRRRIKFQLAPLAFRAVLKRAMYRYHTEGRRNRPPPSDSFVLRTFINLLPFLRYLERLGIVDLAQVNSATCLSYVDWARSHRRPGKKPLARGTLQLHFQAVEVLHDVTKGDVDGLSCNPWPHTSAQVLAGVVGANSKAAQPAKTAVIPDTILVQLYQAATAVLDNSLKVLDLRDAWLRCASEKTWSQSLYHAKYNAFLAARGWHGGARELNRSLVDIRVSCYVVLASLSGCRSHELAYVQRGATRSTVVDGERFWWLTSRSTKTGVGACEWMIPLAAVRAAKILERWARPYQDSIRSSIASMRERGDPESAIAEATLHKNALFLGRGDGAVPSTLDIGSLNRALKEFATKYGIHWTPRTHQFRRTFAVYAARSNFGDLRYLKEHFKHWSMDMTLMYALSEHQEQDLLSEIAEEISHAKQEVVSEWMESSTKLAGVGGGQLIRFREANPVWLYKSRSEMVEAVAATVHIRSNGHAWCTADRGNTCVGNNGLEGMRCASCPQGVIGARHLGFYERTRDDLSDLLKRDDIGPAGRERVERDLAKCMSVIDALAGDEYAC